MAGKRSGLEKKKKKEGKTLPLWQEQAIGYALVLLGAALEMSLPVNPRMHKLCGSRQLCSLLHSLISFLFYIVYTMVIVPHLLFMQKYSFEKF